MTNKELTEHIKLTARVARGRELTRQEALEMLGAVRMLEASITEAAHLHDPDMALA